MEFSKHDWKLYREKLPVWQEAYMERLCGEYLELLNSNEKASDKFWKLDERIKEDRKKPGVIVQIERSAMPFQIIELIRDGAINFFDLNEFSDELKEYVKNWL